MRLIVLNTGHEPETVTSAKVIVGEPVQLSVAVAVPVFAGKELAEHWIVTFGGQVIDGAALSSTKIIWLHVLEFPQASVDFQVRVIVLSCAHTPATVTSVKVTTGAPSQLSDEDAVPVLAGSVLAVQSTVTFGGQTIEGGVLSSTKMV